MIRPPSRTQPAIKRHHTRRRAAVQRTDTANEPTAAGSTSTLPTPPPFARALTDEHPGEWCDLNEEKYRSLVKRTDFQLLVDAFQDKKGGASLMRPARRGETKRLTQLLLDALGRYVEAAGSPLSHDHAYPAAPSTATRKARLVRSMVGNDLFKAEKGGKAFTFVAARYCILLRPDTAP